MIDEREAIASILAYALWTRAGVADVNADEADRQAAFEILTTSGGRYRIAVTVIRPPVERSGLDLRAEEIVRWDRLD